MKEVGCGWLGVHNSCCKRLRSLSECDHVLMAQLDVLGTVDRISPISNYQGLTTSLSKDLILNIKLSTLNKAHLSIHKNVLDN